MPVTLATSDPGFERLPALLAATARRGGCRRRGCRNYRRCGAARRHGIGRLHPPFRRHRSHARHAASDARDCRRARPRAGGNGSGAAACGGADRGFHGVRCRPTIDNVDALGVRLGRAMASGRRGRALRARRHCRLSVLGADERDPRQGRRGRAAGDDGADAGRGAQPAGARRRRSIVGVDEIWRVGGAQAIAALAYGTDDDRAGRQDRRPGQCLCRGGQAAGLRPGRHRHDRRAVGDPGRRRPAQRSGLDRRRSAVAGRARRGGAVDPDHRRCRLCRCSRGRGRTPARATCRGREIARASWQAQRRHHPRRRLGTRRRR